MDLRTPFFLMLLLLPFAGADASDDRVGQDGSERASVIVEYTQAVYDFGGPTKKVMLEGPITITSDTLEIRCDRAEVHSSRESSAAPSADPSPNLGTIDYILAVGNVDIRQMGTQALAGRAEIFPLERKLVLEDNPRIVDANGTVSGHRITFLQGERQIRIEAGESGERNRIELNDIRKIEFLMGEEPDASAAPVQP
jgi:lipopolysaccharide export system protein LptA